MGMRLSQEKGGIPIFPGLVLTLNWKVSKQRAAGAQGAKKEEESSGEPGRD